MPKAVALHDIAPCPNCGYVAKQARHQQRHVAICRLLPAVSEVAAEIQESSLAEVSRKYTTAEQAVTETFLRRLMQTNNYPTRAGGSVEDIIWASDWAEDGQPCAACGILTSPTAVDVPEQVTLKHTFLVSHQIEHPEELIENKLTRGWQTKLPNKSDVLCHMCYTELGLDNE